VTSPNTRGPSSSPRTDNICHAPSPVSSDNGAEVPTYYSGNDHSSPPEVPVFEGSRKRRTEAVERFFESVKREKIEPNPTKGESSCPHISLLPRFTNAISLSFFSFSFSFPFFVFFFFFVETLEFLVNANEIIEHDEDFLTGFDMNESVGFLETLKTNIESMTAQQLNELLGENNFPFMEKKIIMINK